MPLHHRPNISVQTTRPMLGIFRSLRSICRPQDRLFLFLFIFTRHGRRAPGFVTTADFRSTSHTLSSAGRRSQQQQQVFTAAKHHSLPASAPQASPRLSQLQHKSNQIKSLLLSHHHSTSALVSEILKSVLQTVQKNKN